MITSRRVFLTGLVSALAAPAIVRAGSLMPIRAPKLFIPLDLLHQRMNELYARANAEMRKNIGQELFSLTSSGE